MAKIKTYVKMYNIQQSGTVVTGHSTNYQAQDPSVSTLRAQILLLWYHLVLLRVSVVNKKLLLKLLINLVPRMIFMLPMIRLSSHPKVLPSGIDESNS